MKTHSHIKPLWLTIISAWLLLLMGCAGTETPRHHPGAIQPLTYPFMAHNGKYGWWLIRYQFHWPPEENPLWHLDMLVANEIVKPVLHRHREDILLWRFHRRAARDGAGHQFSFIFFTESATARKVLKALRSRHALELIEASGDLARVVYDEGRTAQKSNVEDTSDPHWPHDLQKAWPWFIMGVSETWLALVGQIATDLHGHIPSATTSDLKCIYEMVRVRMTEQWREHAAHAFVHHLNALFGYEPFKVKHDTLLRF